MKFEINETCKKCGTKFNPVKDYYLHWFSWMSHFGMKCPNCGERYYYFSKFELAACIFLIVLTLIILIAALFGVRI